MASGGMRQPSDLGRSRLIDRRSGVSPPADTPQTDADGTEDESGRPCWLHAGDEATAGTVHAWRRNGAGWEALVVAWVPEHAVRPR